MPYLACVFRVLNDFDFHKEFFANKNPYNGIVGGLIKNENNLFSIATKIDSTDVNLFVVGS